MRCRPLLTMIAVPCLFVCLPAGFSRLWSAKTAERIEGLFVLKSLGDPGNILLDGGSFRCSLCQITLASCYFNFPFVERAQFLVLDSVFRLHWIHQIRTIVIDDDPSFCLSVLSVMWMCKEGIEVLFVVAILGGPRKIVLDSAPDTPTLCERSGGKFCPLSRHFWYHWLMYWQHGGVTGW